MHFSSSTSTIYYGFFNLSSLACLNSQIYSSYSKVQVNDSRVRLAPYVEPLLSIPAPPPLNKLYIPLSYTTLQCKHFVWDKITQIPVLFLFTQICMWNLYDFETASEDFFREWMFHFELWYICFQFMVSIKRKELLLSQARNNYISLKTSRRPVFVSWKWKGEKLTRRKSKKTAKCFWFTKHMCLFKTLSEITTFPDNNF